MLNSLNYLISKGGWSESEKTSAFKKINDWLAAIRTPHVDFDNASHFGADPYHIDHGNFGMNYYDRKQMSILRNYVGAFNGLMDKAQFGGYKDKDGRQFNINADGDLGTWFADFTAGGDGHGNIVKGTEHLTGIHFEILGITSNWTQFSVNETGAQHGTKSNGGSESGRFDPSISTGETHNLYTGPNAQVDAHYSNKIWKGKSPVEYLVNRESGKVESITFGGVFTAGADNSYTVKSGFMSFGIDSWGQTILDFSIPTGSDSEAGTTFIFNTNQLRQNLSQVISNLSFFGGYSSESFNLSTIHIP